MNTKFNEMETDMQEATTAQVLGPDEGPVGRLGAMGVRFMVDAGASGGGFSLVEHPIAPRGLAAPLHRHTHEDEYSFVLEGHIGARLGDDTVYAQAGDLIFKPRGQWHTFWNAGDEPARILEIIAPGGFESYFEQMSELLADGTLPDPARVGAIAEAHGLEVDIASMVSLCAEHGLNLGL